MVGAVSADADNLQDAIDEIFDIRGTRPDIDDGADPFAGAQIVCHSAEKTVLSTAVDPGSPHDIAPRASRNCGLLAGDLRFPVYVGRSRLVMGRVWRSSDRLPCKRIMRAELNYFPAHPGGHVRKCPRSF